MPKLENFQPFSPPQEAPIQGSQWGNRLGASIDSYQAGLYGVAEALGSDWAGEQRRANELEADYQRRNAQRLGAIDSYRDVGGVGDALNYVGGLAVDSAPYLGEAAVGAMLGGSTLPGTAARLGLGSISRAGARTLGAVGASYPSAVGDILQNQREAGGYTDLTQAAIGGVPYAALNAFGLEGAVARGLPRAGAVFDSLSGIRGGAARAAVAGGVNAAGEGLNEFGQEVVNQYFGRMATNPQETLFSDNAVNRYGEAFIGGATLGGVAGAGLGGWRRSREYYRNPEQDPGATPVDLLQIGYDPMVLETGGRRQPMFVDPSGAVYQDDLAARHHMPDFVGGPYSPYEADSRRPVLGLRTEMSPLQPRIDATFGIGAEPSKTEVSARREQATTAFNEPSGVYVIDPETQLERQLSNAELAALQAGELATPVANDVTAATQRAEKAAKKTIKEEADARTKSLIGYASDSANKVVGALDKALAAGTITPEEFDGHINDLARAVGPNAGQMRSKIYKSISQLLQTKGQQNVGVSSVSPTGSGGGSTSGSVDAGTGVVTSGRDATSPGGTGDLGSAAGVGAVGGQTGAVPSGSSGGAPAVIGGQLDFAAVDQRYASDPRISRAIRLYMGVDNDGNRLDEQMSMRAAAAKAGLGQNSHDRVSKALKELGITKELRNRFWVGEQGASAGEISEADYEEQGEGAWEDSGPTLSDEVAERGDRESMSQAGIGTVGSVGGSQGNVDAPRKGLFRDNPKYKKARLKGFQDMTIQEHVELAYEAAHHVTDNQNDREVKAYLETLNEWLRSRPGIAARFADAYNRYTDNKTGDIKVTVNETTEEQDRDSVREIADPNERTRDQAESGASEVPEAGSQETPERQGEQAPPPEVRVKKRRKIEKPGGENQLSTDEKSGGVDATVAEKLVRRLFPGNKKVRVVQTMDDAVDLLGASLSEQAMGKVKGVTAPDGSVVLIADNLKDNRDVLAVALHELGGHVGIERFFPQGQLDALAAQIEKWAKLFDNSLENRIAQDAMIRVGKYKLMADQKGRPATATSVRNETIAYFLEEAVKAGVDPTAIGEVNSGLKAWLTAVMNALKRAARALGLAVGRMSVQDYVDLAYGLANVPIIQRETGLSPRVNALSTDEMFDFSTDVPDNFQQEKMSKTEEHIRKLPVGMRPAARAINDAMRRYGGRALNHLMFTEDLLDRAVSSGLRSAKKYKDLMVQRAKASGEHERAVSRIADMYQEVPDREKGTGPGTVNGFIYDSTQQNKWGFKPDWLPDAKVDADMAARFEKLSAQSQALTKAMFKHGYEALQAKKQIVLDHVASEYDNLIADAKKRDDEKKAKEYEKDKASLLTKYNTLFKTRGTDPYAPIKRFGNWVVVAKSAEYLGAERRGDKAEMEKLESDENHYYVDFATSETEAMKYVDRLKETGNYEMSDNGVVYRERELMRNKLYGGNGLLTAFTKLKAQIDMEYGDAKGEGAGKQREAVRKLNEMVTELFLESLAEGSARKTEMRRRGIAGNIDMLKSFATQGRADANFMASIKFDSDMHDQINLMRNEVRTGGRAEAEKSKIFNEIIARHLQMADYQPTPIADKLSRLTSLWFLSTSPGYYLQNATQPWMLSMPVMAGKHGYTETANALLKAYREISFKSGELDYESLPEDVREVVQELLNKGRIDIGFETELGKFQLEGDGKVKDAWNKTDKFLRDAQQKLEAINRLSTAVAAYRLEFAKSKDAGAAKEYADRIVRETHGDYNRENAPRAFNTGFGKVALQFRKFQLIQLTLLAKLFRDAFNGSSPEEKAVARKAIVYMLSHAGIVGGASGLPLFSAVAWAIGKLFGSDADEPPEYVIRRAIGDQQIADLILKGVPSIVGLDMTKFGGFGTTFSALPFTDIDLSSREGVANLGYAILGGPTAGLTLRAADGVGFMQNGQYWRGVENFLPTGFSNPMKGLRYATQGVVQKDGDMVMSPDETNFAEALAQAIGATPMEQTRRVATQNASYQINAALREQGSEIKRDYSEAARNRDTAGMAQARKEWEAYQVKRESLGFKRQNMGELLKAPAAQAKRERQTAGTTQYTPASKGFAQQLSDI